MSHASASDIAAEPGVGSLPLLSLGEISNRYSYSGHPFGLLVAS